MYYPYSLLLAQTLLNMHPAMVKIFLHRWLHIYPHRWRILPRLKGKDISVQESLVESTAENRMWRRQLWFWFNISVFLFKICLYFTMYLWVHKHIVPWCICVTVDTGIASYCGVVKQSYHVLMYFLFFENSIDICRMLFELQFIQ